MILIIEGERVVDTENVSAEHIELQHLVFKGTN